MRKLSSLERHLDDSNIRLDRTRRESKYRDTMVEEQQKRISAVKDQVKKKHADAESLLQWTKELQTVTSAVLTSKTWKAANRIKASLRMFGLHHGHPPAERHFDQVKARIEAWEQSHKIEKEKHSPAQPKVEIPFDLPPLKGLGNDYSHLEEEVEKARRAGIDFYKKASFIIPVYNRKLYLDRTLAALTHQTYPSDLFEIIVADDGSSDGVEEVVDQYTNTLDISMVRQEDQGFRLSAIRNKAIRKAKNDYIIFMDCDIIPAPDLLKKYMTWFHVTDAVVLCGLRRFVNADSLSSDDILKDINVALNLPDTAANNDVFNPSQSDEPTKDWRLRYYEKNDNLKREAHPFRFFVCGSAAAPKVHLLSAGLFDEDFVGWGGEDTEMGFRLEELGLYIIPVPNALALHQDHPFSGSRREESLKRKKMVEDKVPLHYRVYRPGVQFQRPKVSIYMPAHNAGRFIKEAVESALNQTYTDLEVCICDDGSTDNTVSVLDEHFKDDPRVRWVTIPHGGIGKASNIAVRMCRGVYIGQLDADDRLLPNALERCVAYLDKHPDVGCVYTAPEWIDKDGGLLGPAYNWPVFSREKLLLNMIVHSFRVFRKKCWARTSGFNEEYENAVDYDMFLRLSDVCRFHHIDEIHYQRRLHDSNTSVIKKHSQTENAHNVVKSYIKHHGLDKEWELFVPDPSEPRKVEFRRKMEASMATKAEEPIFVFAASPRSGSTLLQRVLNATPGVLIWGENKALNHILKSYRIGHPYFSSREGVSRQILSSQLHMTWTANLSPESERLEEGMRLFFYHLYAQPSVSQGRPRWGIKEVRANAVEISRFLLELYPNARFLYLVRDPYDTLASYLRTSWVQRMKKSEWDC
ncbi:MAG: glycosyltransferase, partial [Deltaproteobacteria bacterium]|nr:glycosyltransferase [Deltaproteobacteria bacterium]